VTITEGRGPQRALPPVTGLHFWVTITKLDFANIKTNPVTGLHFWVTITRINLPFDGMRLSLACISG